MSAKLNVRIIFKDEGYGLTKDAKILHDVLKMDGLSVECVDTCSPSSTWDISDVNLFLESINATWSSLARVNLLIPNPEWLRPETQALLGKMDRVLCKSIHATRIFEALDCPNDYIGFTCVARAFQRIQKDYRKCLHIAGKSPHKGTEALIDCWSNHPEWPVLLVLTQSDAKVPDGIRNIRIIRRYLDDNAIWRLQSHYGIHLCPSESEGYGHTIAEGMAAGAVVLTVDAPPMNELIQEGIGFLVPVVSCQPLLSGVRHRVESRALADTVSAMIQMSESDLTLIAERARQRWRYYDRQFKRRLKAVVRRVL